MTVFPFIFTPLSLQHCEVMLKQVRPKPNALKVHVIDVYPWNGQPPELTSGANTTHHLTQGGWSHNFANALFPIVHTG